MKAPADDTPAVPRGRATLRRVQVAIYVAFAVGIILYARHAAQMTGRLEMLTYLLAFYMAARAVAIWVKFRQESAESRYSRAYVEALDIPVGGAPDNDDDDDTAAAPAPDTTKDKDGHG